MQYFDFDEDDESGESGGGREGAYQQHRDMSRDDLLPEEKRRLLLIEKELNKSSIDRAKQKRKDYQAKKEGNVQTHQYSGAGFRGGVSGRQMKAHWTQQKAYFSGVSKQETPNPQDNRTEVNNAPQQKLELANRLTARPTNQPAPKFNPKPRPY